MRNFLILLLIAAVASHTELIKFEKNTPFCNKLILTVSSESGKISAYSIAEDSTITYLWSTSSVSKPDRQTCDSNYEPVVVYDIAEALHKNPDTYADILLNDIEIPGPNGNRFIATGKIETNAFKIRLSDGKITFPDEDEVLTILNDNCKESHPTCRVPCDLHVMVSQKIKSIKLIDSLTMQSTFSHTDTEYKIKPDNYESMHKNLSHKKPTMSLGNSFFERLKVIPFRDDDVIYKIQDLSITDAWIYRDFSTPSSASWENFEKISDAVEIYKNTQVFPTGIPLLADKPENNQKLQQLEEKNRELENQLKLSQIERKHEKYTWKMIFIAATTSMLATVLTIWILFGSRSYINDSRFGVRKRMTGIRTQEIFDRKSSSESSYRENTNLIPPIAETEAKLQVPVSTDFSDNKENIPPRRRRTSEGGRSRQFSERENRRNRRLSESKPIHQQSAITSGYNSMSKIPSRKNLVSECSTIAATDRPFVQQQSQFRTEYEPVSIIGAGGFGLVFEVYHRTDDCRKAVKRIKIPKNEELRVKFMREVRTMAKVIHPNIIRYYHSWTESSSKEAQKVMNLELGKLPRKENLRDEAIEEAIQQELSLVSSDESETSSNENSLHRVDTKSNDSWICFQAQSDSSSSNTGVESVISKTVPHRRDSNLTIGRLSTVESSTAESKLEANSHCSALKSDCDTDASSYWKSNTTESDTVSTVSCFDKNEQTITYLYCTMELCKWNLRNLIDARKHYSEQGWSAKSCKEILLGTIEALEYLHNQKLIHRDIKPSNILLDDSNTPKLGDFGLSRGGDSSVESIMTQSSSSELSRVLRFNSTADITTDVGTGLYMAPELKNTNSLGMSEFSKSSYRPGSAVDIYALGLVTLELFSDFGSTKMNRLLAIQDAKRSGMVKPGKWASGGIRRFPNVVKLVQKMLKRKPHERPSAHGVKKFISNQVDLFEAVIEHF